jgi:hypothetical protein
MVGLGCELKGQNKKSIDKTIFSIAHSGGSVVKASNLGARKLTGENFKVVWAEFSTFCNVCNCMAYTEACLSLELGFVLLT